MKEHDRNGRTVADFLNKHKRVKKVCYPGLPDHPQHELAKQQMSGFGPMITFETGSLANANRMLKKVRICSLAESLGGVETLISHPATMTHAALGEKGRKAIGITDGMVRISVGSKTLKISSPTWTPPWPRSEASTKINESTASPPVAPEENDLHPQQKLSVER